MTTVLAFSKQILPSSDQATPTGVHLGKLFQIQTAPCSFQIDCFLKSSQCIQSKVIMNSCGMTGFGDAREIPT